MNVMDQLLNHSFSKKHIKALDIAKKTRCRRQGIKQQNAFMWNHSRLASVSFSRAVGRSKIPGEGGK